MSVYDELKEYIIKKQYKPKTSMENLLNMIFDHFEIALIDEDIDVYTKEEVIKYLEASGGITEFDYYC